MLFELYYLTVQFFLYYYYATCDMFDNRLNLNNLGTYETPFTVLISYISFHSAISERDSAIKQRLLNDLYFLA